MIINLPGSFGVELFKPIRDKVDVLLVIFKTMELSLTLGTIDHKTDRHFFFKQNLKENYRVFYVSPKKIFTVFFPFGINKFTDGSYAFKYKTVQQNLNPAFFEIDLQKISLMTEWANQLKKLEGILFNNLFEIIYPEDDRDDSNILLSPDEKEYCIEIFLFLLHYNEGYLRYEDDLVNENGAIHPRYHFDIFFEEKCSFKIGSNNVITKSDFGKLLDNNIERWLIHPNKVS